MKALSISRICLVGMLIVGLAVGLFIESSVRSPHVLMGKELLNVRGGLGDPKCQLQKSCEDNGCPSHCSGDKFGTCSGSGGSATVGCYTIAVVDKCGISDDPEKNCHNSSCAGCACP